MKQSVWHCRLVISLLFATVSAVTGQGVLINEIMYHPSSENPREEYIELLNTGPTNVNLTGWRISSGIAFSFATNTLIGTGKYLVVAADLPAFTAKYPGVTNVVGGWLITTVTNVNGRNFTNSAPVLSNTRNTINLRNAAGDTINSVTYADDGDWAVRQKGPLDQSQRGWTWVSLADGLGRSLELKNPALRNDSGQNWADSAVANGTPGAANSVLTNNVAPMILDTRHLPIIPRSTDTVTIQARIVDESASGLTVTLRFRTNSASPPAFASAPMFDDGVHGDAGAGDGIYGALLPPMPNNTIIEFYVQASDAQGYTRTWPAPVFDAADLGGASLGQAANALFQVDDTVVTGSTVVHKLIITAAEITQLTTIFNVNVNSDAEVNATFINIEPTSFDCHYLCGVRNRGHGSRSGTPHNYRVTFRSDDLWKGVSGLNINARDAAKQVLGGALAQKSGAAGNNSRFAVLRVNNGAGPGGTPGNGGLYASNESLDNNWASRNYPEDSGGNIYAVVRDITPPNFNYRGENKSSYATTYFKNSNTSEDDWQDIIGMLQVMGENQTNLFTSARVRAVIDPEQWLRHLAVMNLLGNDESGLNTGNNDDYYFYRGLNDPRFVMVYHDLDSILGGGLNNGSQPVDSPIFRATCCPVSGDSEGSWRAMNWFMHQPEFEAIYYRTLQDLLNTTFAQPQFDAMVNQIYGDYPQLAGTTSSVKTYMNQRRAYVQGVITPFVPAVTNRPVAVISGEPRSPTWQISASLAVSGAGLTHYQWRLNGGAWSAETPVATPILLNSLPNGSSNVVQAIGKNSSGVWQSITSPTVSRSWVVNTAIPKVRLNEVLARNVAAVNYSGTFPDLIELYNEGGVDVDLTGLRLTDDAANPGKFVFPATTLLPAGGYLVVYANNPDATPGFHLGFSLGSGGESVSLFDRVASGGARLDSVQFGLQLADLSIGRFGSSGAWSLTQPTFGSVNIAQSLGNPASLKINEWLAASQPPFTEDFIELYNPDALPVALGGMYFTDEPIGAPTRHRIADLSFAAGGGYALFTAVGQTGKDASQLKFRLASEQGSIALLNASLAAVDCVTYGAQTANISIGRCPNGALTISAMGFTTPGAPNYCPAPPAAPQVVNLITLSNTWSWHENTNLDGVSWQGAAFDDTGWATGQALFGTTTTTVSGQTTRTLMAAASARITRYFRSSFVVPTNLNATSLRFYHCVDDGAVFYVNGVEVLRYLMPQGAVLFSTTASAGFSGVPPLTGPVSFPLGAIQPGTNTFAVEVHQFAGSSDCYFMVGLDALIVTNSAAGIVINEVLADNTGIIVVDGRTPDWIEFYNASSSPVDMGGLSVNDQANNTPPRWIFPAGSIIPGSGYLVLYADGNVPASATNTGFGLKATGGSVYLFNKAPNTNDLVDRIDYGIQIPDFAIGRVPSGGTNWVLTVPTPGLTNVASPLGDASGLRVNEWMADSLVTEDWFELFNPDPRPVPLGGLRLTDTPGDLNPYRIPALSFIGAVSNAFTLFWADNPSPPAGPDHVNFKLAKTGESIILLPANGGTQIDGISFGPQTTDVSQGRLPDGGTNIVFFPTTPTPKDSNYLPLPGVVVNEVLSHTDLPLEDALELRNLTAQPVNIGGWWLSDTKSTLLKYRIPNGTMLPANGFKVFYENQFNNVLNGVPFSFSSSKGDTAYLSQMDTNAQLTGYRALSKFGPAANGVSFGRYVNSQGDVDYPAMSALSLGTAVTAQSPTNQLTVFRTGAGATNPYPKVGPVIVSEIMYHPPDIIVPGVSTNDNTVEEFIELRNIGAATVPLYDPANPTNGWRLRTAVSFNFNASHAIPPGGHLIVVGFNPMTNAAALAQFRAKYGSNFTLAGPWSGKLNNSSDTVELYKPDPPQTTGPDIGLVPYILVEKVVYADKAPWPVSPDGFGPSLQRLSATGYANDVTNWLAAAAAPGPSGLIDTDGDGMPDDWEMANGLNKNDPSDAGLDPDMDGMTNLQEYLAGTDPRNAASVLRLVATLNGGGVDLTFSAVAGRTYTILYADAMPSGGTWQRLTDVPSQGVTGGFIVHDVSNQTGAQRYYRIITPAWP